VDERVGKILWACVDNDRNHGNSRPFLCLSVAMKKDALFSSVTFFDLEEGDCITFFLPDVSMLVQKGSARWDDDQAG